MFRLDTKNYDERIRIANSCIDTKTESFRTAITIDLDDEKHT